MPGRDEQLSRPQSPSRRRLFLAAGATAAAFLTYPNLADASQMDPDLTDAHQLPSNAVIFRTDPQWGLLEEVVDRSTILYQEHPQLPGKGGSLFFEGGILSDGKTTTGEQKALRLSMQPAVLAEGRVVNGIYIPFPGITENVGLSLDTTGGNLKIVHEYNPGESRWVPRRNVYTLRGVDLFQEIEMGMTYAQGGEIRSLFIFNGRREPDIWYPNAIPPINA